MTPEEFREMVGRLREEREGIPKLTPDQCISAFDTLVVSNALTKEPGKFIAHITISLAKLMAPMPDDAVRTILESVYVGYTEMKQEYADFVSAGRAAEAIDKAQGDSTHHE